MKLINQAIERLVSDGHLTPHEFISKELLTKFPSMVPRSIDDWIQLFDNDDFTTIGLKKVLGVD